MPKFAGFLARKELIEFFPMESLRFFKNFINAVIERRKQKLEVKKFHTKKIFYFNLNFQKRDDFIQNILEHEENPSLIEQKLEEINHDIEGKVYKWNSSLSKILTNKEILSQSILFILAGYETTSQTLCFIAYNLAQNPNYQDKLCEEIDTVLDRHVNFKFNFEKFCID